MGKIIEKIFANITSEGVKSTLLGLFLMAVSVYGILFSKTLIYEDENLVLKIMYVTGAVGVLLCLLPDNFMKYLLEWAKKYLDKKINPILIICVIVLSNMMGCTIVQQAKSHSEKDSIIYKEIVRIDTLKIGRDSVRVVFVTNNIHDTIIQQGRAKIRVQNVRDSIIITANCDSMEKLLLSKNILIEKYRTENDTLKEQVNNNSGGATKWWMLLTGFLVGILLMVTLKIVLK